MARRVRSGFDRQDSKMGTGLGGSAGNGWQVMIVQVERECEHVQEANVRV